MKNGKMGKSLCLELIVNIVVQIQYSQTVSDHIMKVF